MIVPAAEPPHRRAGWGRLFELVRFGAVGASSAVLYLALYTVAVLAGMPYVPASILGFIPAVVSGYLLHDRWTFRTNTPTRGGLARWLALQGTVAGLNTLALWLLVTQAGLNRIVAQLLVLPFLPPATYVLSRRRVFGAA